ncbi:hypothetical protein MJT46_018669 [Ovis ammon polii x Ovis aries]|nr:hypothetical protein MJT46_018669 [Ovis ammon polii x Ovis aries]
MEEACRRTKASSAQLASRPPDNLTFPSVIDFTESLRSIGFAFRGFLIYDLDYAVPNSEIECLALRGEAEGSKSFGNFFSNYYFIYIDLDFSIMGLQSSSRIKACDPQLQVKWKIYYYLAFIIKIYDLGLSFLPLYKAKRDIGYFDNLKVDSRNVTNSMTFATKSNNQNFIIFLNKIQATIIGTHSASADPVKEMKADNCLSGQPDSSGLSAARDSGLIPTLEGVTAKPALGEEVKKISGPGDNGLAAAL